MGFGIHYLHRNRSNNLSATFDQIIHQSKQSSAGNKHLSVYENLKQNKTNKPKQKKNHHTQKNGL